MNQNTANFYCLLNPSEFVPLEACQAETVYWVRSRSIGSIAICKESPDGLVFEGLREKLGSYMLFSEYHDDTGPPYGTLYPLLEMGAAPKITDITLRKEWFLDREVEVQTDLANWLQGMPADQRPHDAYEIIRRDAEEALQFLVQLRDEGMDNQPIVSFKSIMAARSKPTS